MNDVLELVARHEGFRSTVYCDGCSASLKLSGFYWVCDCRFSGRQNGHLTVGAGIRVDGAGISVAESDALLLMRLKEAVDHLLNYSWYRDLTESRQAALVDLCHNVGRAGFDEFKAMIAYIASGQFDYAAAEMLDSKWAKQVPARAAEDAKLLQEG